MDILTESGYADDTYEGIPDLVESINIQSTGPAEASRAIRKKLKHGNSHQQYRALVILNALVENGDAKMRTRLFVDGNLTDVLRNMSNDFMTEQRVKKKLIRILASWHAQYKDDPSMKTVANLYKQHKSNANSAQSPRDDDLEAAKRKSKEEEQRKAKEEAERLKREEKKKREKKDMKPKSKRKPFNFEEEKPKILTQIASATQSANNLVNAITLVNREQETVQENVRVQECLAAVKQERKPIVRYTQLVENEDMIGTLIETNDRIIAALEMYDAALKPTEKQDEADNVQKGLAAVTLEDSELTRLQGKQRAAVDRAVRGSGEHVHPDLQDLNFGAVGEDRGGLPPPLRPNARQHSLEEALGRGSLSDFSDYESSDEETHNENATSSSNNQGRRAYPGASDFDLAPKKGLLDDDPFADPFGDGHGVDDSSSTRENGKQRQW